MTEELLRIRKVLDSNLETSKKLGKQICETGSKQAEINRIIKTGKKNGPIYEKNIKERERLKNVMEVLKSQASNLKAERSRLSTEEAVERAKINRGVTEEELNNDPVGTDAITLIVACFGEFTKLERKGGLSERGRLIMQKLEPIVVRKRAQENMLKRQILNV